MAGFVCTAAKAGADSHALAYDVQDAYRQMCRTRISGLQVLPPHSQPIQDHHGHERRKTPPINAAHHAGRLLRVHCRQLGYVILDSALWQQWLNFLPDCIEYRLQLDGHGGLHSQGIPIHAKQKFEVTVMNSSLFAFYERPLADPVFR